jgi:hypothetical protein
MLMHTKYLTRPFKENTYRIIYQWNEYLLATGSSLHSLNWGKKNIQRKTTFFPFVSTLAFLPPGSRPGGEGVGVWPACCPAGEWSSAAMGAPEASQLHPPQPPDPPTRPWGFSRVWQGGEGEAVCFTPGEWLANLTVWWILPPASKWLETFWPTVDTQ